MTTTLLGVRHHGPGSARVVRDGLMALRPDIVLIEGPPEAGALLTHVDGLVPPVALLAHAVDDPRRAAFWPFAEWSPEWQAVRWAAAAGVPVEFIDLPAAITLADESPAAQEVLPQADPLGWLSEAAGYDDPERWWEDVVEARTGGDALDTAAAIAEAMISMRAEAKSIGIEETERDALREAAMRRGLRAATRQHGSIAVVCGAWHIPALLDLPSAKSDTELLRGLPTVKTQITWVPWTSRRLAQTSGYGAGVASPGWYSHLWSAPDHASERWIARTCRVLREADLQANPASAVETVRLAETLAALRARSRPGLGELTEATQSVLCGGDPIPLQLVADRLILGDDLGQVPDGVPTVPLQADIDRTIRRLRLKLAADDKQVDLDLRREVDLERSRLLHRLRLLAIDWGRTTESRGTGSYRESWVLRWEPALSVAVVDAARQGTTVVAAATEVVRAAAVSATELPAVTALVEEVVLADLPGALPSVVAALDRLTALTGDLGHLLTALPPLGRVLRYGDVRGTDTALVGGVVDGLLVRLAVGLAPGVAGADEEAARALLDALDPADAATVLVGSPEQLIAWRRAQRALIASELAPPLLIGRCVRLLLDAGDYAADEVASALSRARGDDPGRVVSWLEGLLHGSGVLLLRDQVLWGLLDGWLGGLTAAAFDDTLPLLRRVFGDFPAPERRQMGERVRRGSAAAPVGGETAEWDPARAALMLPVLRALLGAADD